MHKYRVMHCAQGESEIALRCSNGRIHLVRVLNTLPAVGVLLNGAKPHLGFGVLVCPVSGSVFRVIFKDINRAGPGLDVQWSMNSAQTQRPERQGAAR